MKEEIWKDIPDYEGHYMISNLGRVKSLSRRFSPKETILKNIDTYEGYVKVVLCKEGKRRHMEIHRLLALSFIDKNYVKNNFVCDHIDRDKKNNSLSNLRIVSVRENNSNNGRKKPTGAFYSKDKKRWMSSICLNGKQCCLGHFDTEEEASKYYQMALKSIENGEEIKVKRKKFSSEYKGICWDKSNKKWMAYTRIGGKSVHLGYFKTEHDAYLARQKALIELEKESHESRN